MGMGVSVLAVMGVDLEVWEQWSTGVVRQRSGGRQNGQIHLVPAPCSAAF
jgi:hypothetical protein